MGKIKDQGAKRALQAWKFAQEQKQNTKYESHVKEFPMMVLNNGVLNAVAFAYCKRSDTGWKGVYDTVQTYLVDSMELVKLENKGCFMEALINICQTNPNLQQVITREILALFSWLKKFVANGDSN